MKKPADVYDYFRAYQGYFYAWEDFADVLAIPGGKTICYTSYLMELLDLLAAEGAPPFGTLLLVITATGEDSHDMLEHVEQILDANYFRFSSDKINRVTGSIKFLKRLGDIAPRYKRGKLRQQLILALFRNGHNLISGRKIRSMLAEMRGAGIEPLRLMEPAAMHVGVLYSDLKPLEVLAAGFPDADSLMRLLADIPDIGELPFEPEAPVAERGAPKDFIEELEADPDTFLVGALIRSIWTGLSIPFHSNHPSLQPLGGVSDISNRGALDKLLLSEHANEDILFLSRLANGEALYINRETPPETDKLQRIILIDSSLQSWGTPRILAYALMLALAHHPRTDISCTGYAVGQSHYPVGYATVDELISSLQRLDASADASAGMASFFSHVPLDGRHEVIFISSPQGYRQAGVRALIHERIGDIGYCMTADEAGEISIYRKRARGLNHLQTFRLPLKELWKNPPARKDAPAMQEPDTTLPSDYPILFPWPNKIRRELVAADGQIFIVSKDNYVLRRWKSDARWRQKGWFFVTDKLPRGACNYEIGLSSKGEYLLLVHVLHKREVHLINLNTKAAASTHMDSFITRIHNPDFIFWEDGFVVRDRHTAWKFHHEPSSDRHDAPALRLTRIDMPAQLEHQKLPFLTQPLTDPVHSSTLRNMKRVGISQAGRLMINSHELKVHGEHILKFTGGAGSGWIPAAPNGANALQFPDGSTVTVNRAGMLVLRSSSRAVGTIFIPSVLDAAIGAATKECYTGSDFYNPEIVPESRRMTAAAFYDKFIEAFITQIKDHATSVKAR